ncbi:MAG TPA: sulfite exporter TauE/SafE family protein [Burkholderiaceae bacterium]|nr:sulfite exporter TauE/SafE family protein [Burkholderiaceae bacterium]
MGTEFFILAAAGAAIGGLVQGLSGFAFSMIAMSVWVWVFDPVLAAVLSVFGALLGQTVGIASVQRDLRLPVIWPFLVGGLVGMPIGFLLLPHMNILYLKLGLGTLLVVWCPAMLFSGKLPQIRFGGRWLDALVGVGGGIAGVLAGLSGALPALWSLLRNFDKDTQRVLTQYFNLIILGLTAIIYSVTGVVTRPMLPLLATVLLVLVVPTFIGAQWYKTINEQLFRRIVLVLLTLSGATLLLAVWV